MLGQHQRATRKTFRSRRTRRFLFRQRRNRAYTDPICRSAVRSFKYSAVINEVFTTAVGNGSSPARERLIDFRKASSHLTARGVQLPLHERDGETSGLERYILHYEATCPNVCRVSINSADLTESDRAADTLRKATASKSCPTTGNRGMGVSVKVTQARYQATKLGRK